MKKRIFALLFAIVMIVWIIPINVLATEAHEHSNENGTFTELDGGKHSYTCSCGEEVVEDCSFGYYTYDDTEHWTECDFCINRINSEPHTMVDCECTGENCDYQVHAVEAWTPLSDDPYKHTGFCTACQQNVTLDHDCDWMQTEGEHWWGCKCGYEDEGSREAHSFSDWYGYNQEKHYRHCGCGYDALESHVDTDNDKVCDVETCGSPVHVDADGDHSCDDCGITLEYLCVDTNQDHVCDFAACREEMYWECIDENDDHVCDLLTCSRYMREYCEDEDEDYICDICEENCCYHYNEDVTSNGDGTHTGICLDCGSLSTEDCDENYSYDYDKDGHYNVCFCDYRFPSEAHVYEEKLCEVRSLAGHWVMCDVCWADHYEVHTASNGTCEVCELELAETFDVYVGGVGLKDGQYLDNAGNVTATKPAGGYAYYKDGILELNGFVYEGIGVMWQESESFESYAPVFATKDLILKLTGENRLSSTAKTEEEDFYLYGDGIAATGSLMVRGEGSLTILSTDDGINVKDGNFAMESGTLILGVLEYNADGSVKCNDEVGDDGIDVDNGDLSFSGGTLSINAVDHGMDVSESITISGGIVNIVAGDDGIEANKTVTITGGKIDIEADDEMIRGSSVTISTATKDDASAGSTADDANDEENSSLGGDVADTKRDGLSGGAIAGITVGTVAAAELGGFSLFWFVIRKKKLSDLLVIFRK